MPGKSILLMARGGDTPADLTVGSIWFSWLLAWSGVSALFITVGTEQENSTPSHLWVECAAGKTIPLTNMKQEEPFKEPFGKVVGKNRGLSWIVSKNK